MGDKNQKKQNRVVEDMEGLGSDQNPLKRRFTEKPAPKEKAATAAAGHSGAKKSQPGAKDHGQGAGSGDPPAGRISIGDLYSAIQAVGRTTKNLERVLEESVCNLNVMDKRMKRVEESPALTCKIATANQTGVRDLWKEIANVRAEMMTAGASQAINNQLRALRYNVERQEHYSRRFNLVFEGFPETEGETNGMLWNRFRSFLDNIMGLSSVKFDIIHCLGAKTGGHRKLIVKFITLTDKNMVWENRRAIKNTPETHYKVLLDKPASVKAREALTFKILYAAQKTGEYRSVKLQNGRLSLDGVLYEYEDYDTLPLLLRPAFVSSPRNATTLVFFSKHSQLSNHYITDFVSEGIRYSSMEQFLARARAVHARNTAMERRVTSIDEPVELKKCLNIMKSDGKENLWKASLTTVLETGLLAKFTQDETAGTFLKDTAPRRLGEGSYNTFWGIGMILRDEKVMETHRWAANTLGIALMNVRDIILQAH